jgi:hypothetical protein
MKLFPAIHFLTIQHTIMTTIKDLAPTIFDAIKAIEQGCRKIQNDPFFSPAMSAWLTIDHHCCLGCLATSTLMQLTNKSGKEIVDHFKTETQPIPTARAERSEAYGLKTDVDNGSYSEMVHFEFAIEFMRNGDIKPLLEFYGLLHHPCCAEATQWYRQTGIRLPAAAITKNALKDYADFLKNTFMPKLTEWFK